MSKQKSVSDIYTEYYLNQAGSGFGSVYAGGVYQKGHGIGSYLGGLFRCVFPLLKNSTSVLGSELMKSGVNILSDISRNGDPEFVIKKRGKETINNIGNIIGEKMFGKGYAVNQIRKRRQSTIGTQSVKKVRQSKNSSKKSDKKKQNKKPSKNSNASKNKKSPKNKKQSRSRNKIDIFDYI